MIVKTDGPVDRMTTVNLVMLAAIHLRACPDVSPRELQLAAALELRAARMQYGAPAEALRLCVDPLPGPFVCPKCGRDHSHAADVAGGDKLLACACGWVLPPPWRNALSKPPPDRDG